MPIYEYVCTACDHRADILHGLNDPGPNFCPVCGREGTMRKQFAAPAIHYKGSGWAKKDRAAKPAKPAASSTPDGSAPKGDTPKGDSPKGDSPKGDSPKGDSPKTDSPKTDASASPAPTSASDD